MKRDLATDSINALPIKAIETHYKGYRFRSRLEARWAVYFDAAGISWEYEKDGYDLGELGRYLPDFWIPINFHEKYESPGYFIEIKGSKPDDLAFSRLIELSKRTKHSCKMFIGIPGEQETFWCHHSGNSGWFESIKHPEKPNAVLRTAAEFALSCLEVQAANETRSTEDAITAARSARFEHGESP